MNAKELSEELRVYVSQFDKFELIKSITLHLNIFQNDNFDIKLISPFKQLFYLARVVLGNTDGSKFHGADKNFWKVCNHLLNKIETEYYMNDSEIESLSEEEIKKRLMSAYAFGAYISNGKLNYKEQESDRFLKLYKNYDSELIKIFGLKSDDWIVECDKIGEIVQAKLNEMLSTVKGTDWTELRKQSEKLNLNPDDFISKYHPDLHHFLKIYSDPGVAYIFDQNFLNENQKIKKVLECVSLNISDNELLSHCEYNEPNDLLFKPVLRFENHYLLFSYKQLFEAVNTCLFNTLKQNGSKVSKSKEKNTEIKAKDVFCKLFGKEAFYHSSYYTTASPEAEQDLLILYKKIAIIVEIKTATFRKPVGDYKRDFLKIDSDFKSSLSEAYKQIWRVKSQFYNSKTFDILDKNKKVQHTINTNRYDHIFSVIVTYDRLGAIQIDLEPMLDLNENDDNYPLSIYIDDLETILLTFNKRTNRIQSLIQYLTLREMLHGKVYCGDELELAGYYLMDQGQFIKNCMSDLPFLSSPDMHRLFDEIYFSIGHGFEGEGKKQIDKSDPVYAILKRAGVVR